MTCPLATTPVILRRMRTITICTVLVAAVGCSRMAQDKQAKMPPRPGLTLTTSAFSDAAE